MTKLTIALAAAAIAFVVRGWTGPAVVFVVVLATAFLARVARPALRVLVLTSPLVISILLVNTFLFPGAKDVIARIGPLAPTWTGLEAALQAVLRVAAFALSVAVFSMTTPTDDLLADLERRGVGRRAVFVIGAAIRTVPRMRDRAGEITDSQRARGLDTEGSRRKRIAGIIPLAGPMIFGALSEVEEQTMALEARAFSAPGRRTVLRAFPDPGAERAGRWLVFLACAAAIAGSIAGLLRLP
ncbi:MAG TPA: energy-coupling factor transporter transmembrane component T [Candidatus Limnocylindrales bacterium]